MKLLDTARGRAVLFGFLYASEGAPIGFIWWSLPTLMRERGGEVGRITALLAAVTAMWALKFLWAPVVDVLRNPRWGFRSWILTAQMGMGLAFLPLAWLDPVADKHWVVVFLVLHALCATIQDVAIDALAINIVPREELGRVNGFMAAGKYIGRGLFGGVALIVAATLGWPTIILAMIGCIWLVMVFVWALPEEAGLASAAGDAPPARERLSGFLCSLRQILRQRVTGLAVGFALVAGAGFEVVGALTGTYLPDRGMSTEDTGWFRAFAVLGTMIVGGLVGGALTDRLGTKRAAALFLIALAGCNAVLSLADLGGWPVPWLLVFIALMYFAYGMFISASYALFMSVTERRVAATQFSIFMAATNGCEVWSGWLGGQIVERAGYPMAFLTLTLFSLAALPLLALLQRSPRQRGVA